MVAWQDFSEMHLNKDGWEEGIEDLLIEVGKGSGKDSPMCAMALA